VDFTKKNETLYPLAYGIKKYYKDQGQDSAVPKREGLWWLDAGRDFNEAVREEWNWELLIRMPEFVIGEVVDRIKPGIIRKKKDQIDEIRSKEIYEGTCAQVLHIRPYSEEHETVTFLMEFIELHGYKIHGLHHEIYLSAPRKIAPAKMKTIIRYQAKAGKQLNVHRSS